MQLGLPFVAAADVYFVRHPRARRYLLRLDAEGRVRVTIPRGGSRREADLFAQKNLAWIEEQRARLVPPRLTVAQRQAARLRADAVLPGLLLARARELGLIVSRVSIRNQRSRWGSCGPGGRITLNWRLVLMPDWVRDYVIVHELMHLKRMDHSPAYWKLVAAVYPDYRRARAWLRAEGLSLR
jgi:predicted metal-dependent hydrolase